MAQTGVSVDCGWGSIIYWLGSFAKAMYNCASLGVIFSRKTEVGEIAMMMAMAIGPPCVTVTFSVRGGEFMSGLIFRGGAFFYSGGHLF